MECLKNIQFQWKFDYQEESVSLGLGIYTHLILCGGIKMACCSASASHFSLQQCRFTGLYLPQGS
jgi:hypothetical protein